MFRIPLKYRWVYKHLSAMELTGDCSFDLGLNELFGGKPQSRFLDYYSLEGIRLALKRYGLVAKLRELGYEQVDVRMDIREDGTHVLRVFEPPLTEETKIAELVVRKSSFEQLHPVLKVEWLCLQNPRGSFTEEKPRLPGQQYPGLGLGKDVLSVIILMGIRLKFQAITNVADHFHNAYIYSSFFYFHDPVAAGRLHALSAFMKENQLKLADMAWALEEDRVVNEETGERFRWESAVQILPLRTALEAEYQSREYRESVQRAAARFRFRLL